MVGLDLPSQNYVILKKLPKEATKSAIQLIQLKTRHLACPSMLQ